MGNHGCYDLNKSPEIDLNISPDFTDEQDYDEHIEVQNNDDWDDISTEEGPPGSNLLFVKRYAIVNNLLKGLLDQLQVTMR
ncbi:hypothetical protein LINPERPRIM_LOCUS14583 [Linum perenne]